ncbi:MAG TPA: benzoate/H(+) symporter BenE family transporter [Burkholderiales bacterium]
MPAPRLLRDLNSASFWAGITVFLWYAFAGIPIHLAVAAQLKLSPSETGSWVLIVWLTSAAASIGASLVYRIPIPITWTIPGIIYLGALAGRFSHAEIAGANLLAGVLMVALGALGVGKRVMTWLPLPIVMGMFAGSILEYGVRLVSATVSDVLVAGTCVLCYLAGRVLNDPRLPPVGLAALGGGAAMFFGRSVVAIDLAWSAPVLIVPEMTFGLAAFAAITLPMVILSMGLGNVQGLGFLQAQGYKVAVNPLSVLVGIASALNATFGGHPAIVARTGVAMLAAKEAGPAEGRYWGAIISASLTLFIAFAGTTIAALVSVLPRSYVFALAGLAILGALQDSLEKSFSGPLRFGALVAFMVAVTPFAILGISSAFWALVAGIAGSALLEREELSKQWRS